MVPMDVDVEVNVAVDVDVDVDVAVRAASGLKGWCLEGPSVRAFPSLPRACLCQWCASRPKWMWVCFA